MKRIKFKPRRRAQKIHPTENEVDKSREIIVNRYKGMSKYKEDKDLYEKVDSVLKKAEDGWPGAPRTFFRRVRFLTGTNRKNKVVKNPETYNQAKSKKGKYKDQELLEEIKKLSEEQKLEAGETKINKKSKSDLTLGEQQVFGILDKESKDFIIERKTLYKNEFELNDSADQTLLMELLCDELTMKKIREMQFKEMAKKTPNANTLSGISKMADEAHKRLQVSMKNLGITRDQRKDELDKKAGDISSISISLDRKKKLKEKLDKVWEIEEMEGLDRKIARGDVYNVDGLPRPIHDKIPEMSDIDEILEESGFGEELKDDLS